MKHPTVLGAGFVGHAEHLVLTRALPRIAEAGTTPPAWLRDADRRLPIVSLSGTAVCSGGCVIALNVNPAFQADLTAGLIIAF